MDVENSKNEESFWHMMARTNCDLARMASTAETIMTCLHQVR
jgi:hypothetical protein